MLAPVDFHASCGCHFCLENGKYKLKRHQFALFDSILQPFCKGDLQYCINVREGFLCFDRILKEILVQWVVSCTASSFEMRELE